MRGTFVVSRACVPHLRKSGNPHVLTLSPQLEMRADWFAQHLPYTLSKYGMSMVTFGMAEEFRVEGIAFNALWPRTTIATAAVEFALGGEALMRRSRRPEIMADAAHAIFLRDARRYTGNFVLDDDVLREEGVTDFIPTATIRPPNWRSISLWPPTADRSPDPIFSKKARQVHVQSRSRYRFSRPHPDRQSLSRRVQ